MNKYVVIGRLEMGISYPMQLGIETYACHCKCLSVGPFFITWLSKYCLCESCGKRTCICGDDDESA